jgi:hypothetical protein
MAAAREASNHGRDSPTLVHAVGGATIGSAPGAFGDDPEEVDTPSTPRRYSVAQAHTRALQDDVASTTESYARARALSHINGEGGKEAEPPVFGQELSGSCCRSRDIRCAGD